MAQIDDRIESLEAELDYKTASIEQTERVLSSLGGQAERGPSSPFRVSVCASVLS